ncbi:MAG: efflux RND transporter permease subunit [Flammeovirgaceae bacterium]
MKLPKIAIANYQFVLILVFLSVLTGFISFITMPRSEDPDTNFPIYRVLVVYPGTSPQDMEKLVGDPIEDVLKEIEEIEKVQTTIQEGILFMRIDAKFGIDIDDKFDEISVAIGNIQSELPNGILKLDISKVSPLDVNIFQLAFVSEDAPYKQLVQQAERLEARLDKLSGVRDVEIEAYPEEQIKVSLDFQKMAAQNIPLKQVVGILQGNNTTVPGGTVNAGTKVFNIQTSGGYKSLEEIQNSVVNAYNDRIVYLKDIAEVTLGYEDETYKGRFNGERAIFLSVTQKGGKNILDVSEQVNQIIDEFKTSLPHSIQLESAFIQAPAVEARINDFFLNLLQGILLVGAILFIFLDGRSSLIVMTVIPTSVIMAIGALDFLGYGMNQISIAGLVIALGLLVDNGIVVIENINRFLKDGYRIKEAAILATSEVGWPVVSSTVTTVLSFFPLIMLNNGPGEFLRALPVIVICCLIASLLLALTFTPLLSSKFLKFKPRTEPKLIERFLATVIENVYRPMLRFSLKWPFVILIISILSFVGSIMLFPVVGVSFFPTADKGLVLVDIKTPEGTNMNKTQEAVDWVESLIDTVDLVSNYATNIGHGNPRVYYNRSPQNFDKSYGQIVINLKEWEQDSFYPFLDWLRMNFDQYTGARITVDELKNGPPYEAPIAIRVLGQDLAVLKKLSLDVEQMITQTKGTLNVDNPFAISKTELKVAVNRDKAGLIGLPLNDVDLTVRAGLTGLNLGEVNLKSGDKYDMVVRMPFDEEMTIDDFNKIYITTMAGAQVPLRQVADLTFQPSASKIFHYNYERNVTITANVLEGYKTAEVTEEIIAQLDNYEFPENYGYYVAGEYEGQQESFGGLGQILIAALVLIFAVLVLQFRSFKQPFVVFSAIPLAFAGSILALYITGFSFSFFAFVGFTSLVGIVVNNSIILVDYSNQLLAKGTELKEAIMKAAETRFTPIILTTLTTIVGLLPLTLTNSNLWSPLGWTIIGGMISSTLLTLLIVPILYKWFTSKNRIDPEEGGEEKEAMELVNA